MTYTRIGMAATEVRQFCSIQLLIPLIAFATLVTAAAYANQPPVADAGPSRYAGSDPIVLDGTGSYDPDPGDTLSYQWDQVSGPLVTLGNTNTATPTLQGTQDHTIQHVVLSLTITDDHQATSSDTVEVIIVPSSPNGDAISSSDSERMSWDIDAINISDSNTMDVANTPGAAAGLVFENQTCSGQPFDPSKPTFVYFTGGNCITGNSDLWGCDAGASWHPYANVISFPSYGSPYSQYADQLITYLSSKAPNYDQPIELAGFSTGGMPAIDSAIRLNTVYQDPRYNVTRVSLLDAACRSYGSYISTFANSSVNGEPAWVVNYYAHFGLGSFWDGAVNVKVLGDHSTPTPWYRSSINRAYLPSTYNHGIVAGAFISVAGPGKNYDVPRNAADLYYFEWENQLTFVHAHQSVSPGEFPEPVRLRGPSDGATVASDGITLGSELSELAAIYQLLVGENKSNLSVVMEEDVWFDAATGPLPPNKVYYWTIKVHETYGASIHADVRSFVTPPGLAGDFNDDAVLDQTDCAILKAALNTTWGHPQFALGADLDGDKFITCNDAQAWLSLYRTFLLDPAAPDPCGLEDATDTDGDGVRDLCDNCPGTANTSQTDWDGDHVGDVCDNCASKKNNNQLDSDNDGIGNRCETDNDSDGWGDLDDNCPNNPNWDQNDLDNDGEGDPCDRCMDLDGDGYGNPGYPANTCPDDNCPDQANADQLNADNDAFGDVCDNCPTVTNPDQADVDADETGDVCDNCPSIWNRNQADFDYDGVGDVCDDDDDNDGVNDTVDNCPVEYNPTQADDDGDGVGDVCDWCPDTPPGAAVDSYGCLLPAPEIPGDFDGDGDVDMEDFGHFQMCISGLSIPQTDPNCSTARMDIDSDVDQQDLAVFQSCMSGADIAGDENCAD